MSFISLGFLVFLVISVFIYYLIPKKYQWIWLLTISYFFYLCSGIKTVFFIIFTTITTFLGGIALSNIHIKRNEYFSKHKSEMSSDDKKEYKKVTKKKKRRTLILILIANFGVWAILKYTGFAIDNLNVVLKEFLHLENTVQRIDFILPMGISFYTFQAMGYIIDVYQGKYEADKNIFKFALFVSFFPQILQGPIGRYNKLAHQFFEKHSFDWVRIQHGVQLIAWGFFKKMVLADRAATVADCAFQYVHLYSDIPMMYGVLMYAVQVYADFAGAMDIVVGAAELFDIQLEANFRQPMFAVSISDFWHRWHITLGTWMKDYIFYPFSLSKVMNKFGKFARKLFGNTVGRILPICIANLLIFFIVGIWHGPEWKYIAYGMYNGLLISLTNLLEPLYPKMFQLTHINPNTKVWKCIKIFRTFLLFYISLYFERAVSVYASFIMLRNSITGFTFSALSDGSLESLGLGVKGALILLVGCSAWFIVSVLKEKGINVREAIDRKPFIIRWAIYIALVLAIPCLGKISETQGGFMYAQF